MALTMTRTAGLPVPGDPTSKFGGVYTILSYEGTRTGAFDGRVDFLDYLTRKANVGDSVPGAVPEPAALALLAIGGPLALLRRRRTWSG